MRRFLSLLVLLAVLALSAQYAGAEEIREETVDAAGMNEEMPAMTAEIWAERIYPKLSNRCQKEVEANPTDAKDMSDRCQGEIGRAIYRYQQRLKEGDKKKETKEKKKSEEKPKKKKKTKMSRAEREAAAAAKAGEEYQQTVTIIAGFIGTLVAVIGGAICMINRKLKDAGMYYPANPEEKAGCCG